MPNRYPVRPSFASAPWRRRLLLLTTTLTTPLGVALAQSPAPVNGTVTNPVGAAIEFATITLHQAADSAVVKTEFSNEQGAFRLLAAAGGHYRVSAAQVGFARFWSAAFELPAAGMVLPPIGLAASQATALKEVTVTARKPPFEHLTDRTVVNVADSPLAAGATTLEVLGRSPGVTVDAGDNLGLRGRTGLLVVIDGKRVPLSGSELADYLKALPAEQLQSIELITNPPASYDAQGGAGVIAINLKKDQRLGTNGSLNASYGRGEYGKFVGGVALNHRRKNVNFYGNYAYTDRQGFLRLDFDRQFAATSALPAARSLTANEQLSQLRSHTGKLGLDLSLSKRTLVGASVSGLINQTNNATIGHTQFYGPIGESGGRYATQAAQDISRPSGSGSLNLRHTFADSATASVISVDADYARYQTTRLLDLHTNYAEPIRPATRFVGDQRRSLTIQSAKIDFTKPLAHRSRLEAGGKATQVGSDNNVRFQQTENGTTIFLPAISNMFRYTENVNAGYLNLSGSGPKTTFQAGLRVEQTNTLAEFSGTDARSRHYAQLFPSATVLRTLSAQHAVGLTVARRIDRPNYGQLNPLRIYVDAVSYSSGNPDLVAQTSYNFELTHTYRQKFSTSLSYAQTNLPIVNVVQPAPDGGRLVVNRDVNLTTLHNYTLTLTTPLDLARWWTLYANGVFYYARYVGALTGTALDRGRVACTLTANNSFTLPKGWSADLNGLYESREVYGFQAIRRRGQIAAGLQKSLWDKQGTLRLNVADIFYTTPIRATSTYDNFTERFVSSQDSRVVTVAFTYRFGSGKVAAARKRAAGADEELRRAAGQ